MPGPRIRRRTGETIRIGDAITITVVETTRGDVTLEIDAPAGVNVLRGEHLRRYPLGEPLYPTSAPNLTDATPKP